MNTQRPQAVTVAAVLLALFSVLSVISTFIPAFSDGVPAVVVYGSAVLGLVGLAAAYGLWSLKKWGVWLSIILSVLNLLSAAPGIAFAPTTLLFVFALVTVIGSALIIVLVLLPPSRRAYA
ncbi:MAG: hypothetical protein H0U55_06745 [Rubrobacteraceae bacterium]|nr:hypothetical protein [Rubrobacteraceae bacterium]